MADAALRQQRQVRAARRPVDRRQGHADQRRLTPAGTQGRDQRRDPAHRPPRDLLLAGGLRGHLSLRHRPLAAPRRHSMPEDSLVLGGKVSGLGVSSVDPASRQLRQQPAPAGRAAGDLRDRSGHGRAARRPRRTARPWARTACWGPFTAQPGTPTNSSLPRPATPPRTSIAARSRAPATSCTCGAERIAEADKDAPAIVTMARPRGYFDPARDKMALRWADRRRRARCRAPACRLLENQAGRSRRARVVAEFNGERVDGPRLAGSREPCSGARTDLLKQAD